MVVREENNRDDIAGMLSLSLSLSFSDSWAVSSVYTRT
jgi:hypothetical protein